MDQLGLVDVAQDLLDLRRRLAQDAQRLRRAVVDQAARELVPAGVEAADELAALELRRRRR